MNATERLQLSPYDFYNPPIVSKRNPTVYDKTPKGATGLGQIWVNKSANTSFILTSVVNNQAIWTGLGGGVFGTAMTITPGDITASLGNIVATAGHITAGTYISATTYLAAGSYITAATTITAGTGLTVTTGNLVVSAGNITTTAGSASIHTTLTAGTGITATTGNITASAGGFVATTAGQGITLGGGAKVICGAGAPTAVTAPQGSLYLNLTGSTTATRLYVNSDSGTTWVAVTTAS